MKSLEKRIGELEKRVRELEARPLQYPVFYPYFVPQQPVYPLWPTTPTGPTWTAGDPIVTTTTTALPTCINPIAAAH